ncbi:monocarboxylate transporter 10 [Bos indicus]|uniref:Solute carrier family 16 member 10 n=3 Tax=Bos TaxID=9903 RepID=A0AAA9SXL6_BOVIN|nr:monocarboxylate transporter 10 [Bos taurus]XP_019822765.1 PREDICTED: monocarboxylate transporter 10 [Bos indicus]XP_027407004.1 monocarboxylate transporter 10 [Bos indicus x Bos taurus]DAA26273.1 TPA: solute carrier family 16, member 10 (aromatic amino acid transporter) [Bos taurus]
MVPSQEEPAAARGTSEAQPPGSAPPGAAPLPCAGPLDGPEAAAAEKVEVELGGSVGAEPLEPPEGGWGWLVMLAAMWCNGSVFGIQNACGVLFVSMLKTFGSKDDDKMVFKTAWVSSLSMGMIFFCCPIVSVFTDIFGCRKTAVVGAAVGFVGLLSSSFVSSIEPLYLTYGIIFACGCSFAYQPSLVILGHYFKKRLGLVNGIVTAGSSIFTILLPFLLRVLTDSVGLFHTLRVLCIFVFVLFLAGFTYRPFASSAKDKDGTTKGGNRLSLFSRRKFSPPKKIFNFAIFKVTAYAVWAVGIPLALFGYFVPYVHLMKYVNERFQDEKNKEVVLMCIGITSGVGRLLFGRIADYVPGVKKIYLQVLSFLFIGLMSMMIPLCSVFGGLIAVCLIMGLFDGCFISIMAPIAFELVGAQDVSQAIGFLLGFMSIPMTVGPPIAGLLRDKLGSYDVAFYLAGIPPLIGGAVLCFIPWVHSKKQREVTKTTGGEKMEKMLANQNSLSSSSAIFKKESDSVI